MKRFATLLLLAWCTAFAQVQPVAVALEQASCCCEECTCGPECAPLAVVSSGASARVVTTSNERAVSAERKAPRQLARSQLPVVPLFSRPPQVTLADSLPAVDDAVPLFSRHCAFLI